MEEKEKKVKKEKIKKEKVEKPKKEAVQNAEGTIINQRIFWIIGAAIIVFLVIVLISVIMLKNVRDDANNLAGSIGNNGNNATEQNYIVLEDGTKENTSEGISKAEYTLEGRKFYDFKVTEKNGISTVEAKIQNITNDVLESASFKVRLFNASKELIKEYTILTATIQPGVSTLTVTNIMEDCTQAVSVEVEMVKAN